VFFVVQTGAFTFGGERDINADIDVNAPAIEAPPPGDTGGGTGGQSGGGDGGG
jgi:hypothetical protein